MPNNNNKKWTNDDTSLLKKLARENTPTRVMGIKLGRTEGAIYNKAQEIKVKLKPTNQSPYGTKKK